MNKTIITTFGTLASVERSGSILYITNTKGLTLKMSARKFASRIQSTHNKALTLIGKQVKVHTSQHKNTWSTSEWFYNIEAA